MEIRKYLKLSWKLLKFSFIRDTAYRFSFFMSIFVEYFYIFSFIVLFEVLYGNVQAIAGWDKFELYILLGFSLIVQDIILATSWIGNIRILPQKIVEGDVDLILTKPVSSMFHLTFSNYYTGGFFSIIAGMILLGVGVHNLPNIGLIDIIAIWPLMLLSLIIIYCMMVIIATPAFIFLNAESLPNLGLDSIASFTPFPVNAFPGLSKLFFYVLFPVIFIAAVPAGLVVKGLGIEYLILMIAVTIGIVTFTVWFWQKMIANYASASS